jgi:hypothetical protein
MEKTLGQKRIGEFNPKGDEVVNGIKQRVTELIDYINDNIVDESPLVVENGIVVSAPYPNIDVKRLKSLAFTDIESAAMWAVKARMHDK